ncbi:MAG: hypothetical protein L6R38_002455 [Xanthoria sp. 2 TBL-2021]|nr:MAG: hypothetical protein L6R38_002455 [Xanthoria sp. 2 TBL-2021]
MNPANFQNMQGQAMPPQPAPQPPASSNNASQVHQFILSNLQHQAPMQGWQSTVQVQYRGNMIFQIFSQLRLLQSQLDLQHQLQLALKFETKAFTDAPDRNTYEHMCKKKLADIHEMRTKQSAGLQQQMNMQINVPQQMQSMTQNPSHGLGPGQFQQGPPNLQQQQMMQLHGMPMQQQPQPPQNMPMRQPQPNMPQAQPSAAPQQMVQHSHQFAPTAEDNQIITQMANRMYSQTPQPRMEVIQSNLSNMDPKTRENLARQGVDPLAWFFRTQAMKRYMEVKRAQAGTHGLPTTQPAGMMNGGPRPMSGGPPAQPMPTPQQNFEPPFDHIFGQQQDGLRSQEAGQIVVPASNPQASLDQRNAARANAQQQMNMQNGANRGLQNVPVNQPQPQAFWNAQAGQRNMNQGAGINANAATNLTAASQAPANLLQGQPGGLDNQITRTPSQQTGMPNLNKAAPPGQAPNMWTQRTPQMNQPKPQGNAMASQAPQQTMERADAPQQRPSVFQNLPPHLQQRLRNMPEDQRRNFLLGLQQRHMEEQQQRQHQQQLQQNLQQQQKMANARAVLNDSFPMSSQPSQPGMQTGPTAPMPNQNTSAQRPPPQNSNAQQPPFPQPNAAMGGPTRPQPGTGQRPPQQRGPSQYQGPLTDEQARHMDQKTFPANMLSHTNQLAPPPKDVKTWGQLKEWAAQNAQTLPPATLEKLKNLQAIQYRAQVEGSRPPQPGTAPASNPQPQAPFAQMVSQPNSQAPVPAPQLTNRITVPMPSLQEIQNFRTGLQPQHKNVTDEQVRAFLIRQRQQEVAKKMQAQQAQSVQMANDVPKAAQTQNQGQGSVGQSDSSQGTQKGQAKGTVQQNPKVAGSATNQSKPGQANRGTPTTKQQQKGTKRSSQDDVVEISNPNLSNTQAGAQAQNTVQASKQQPPAGSNEQKVQGDSKGSANLKGASQSQNGEAPGVRPPGVLRNLPQQDMDRRDARLKQLMTEVGQSQPPRRPVQMTAQVKNEMSQKLRELAPMVSRMEISLPTFFRYNPDEDIAKQLIRTRQIIKAQYRDDKYNLVEHFTIGQAELEAAYTKVKSYFFYVMEKFGGKSKAAPQPGEQAQNQPQPQQATPSQEKAPLNAANLDEHQNMLKAQRAAAMQRHHSGYGSRAPAAPTSEKPPPFPLPLGPQSPHGIPHQYGPTTLTADKLVLPQSKRRRSNNHQPSAGSTPVPAHDTPVAKSSPVGPKHTSPEITKAPMPQLSFKCGVSDCQASQKGFATHSELEQHNADVHEPQEPIIDDPVEFALESMRLALGLDENGKSKPQQIALEAPKMKPSLSAQSHASIKQETSTPMARAGTQTGPSPASNLLKTPQASSGIKTPASDASKGKNVKGSTTPPKETTPPPFDPWAGSCISPEGIRSSWSSLADLNSMSFTSLQKGLTPSSTDFSSNEKSERNSPRTSDISENDVVKISIDVKKDKDNWIPSEWFDDSLYNDIESMNFGPDHFMQDAGWDIFAGIEDTQMIDIGPTTGKGKKKDEQDFVSEEWLKVYAPEKLPVKRGK